VTESGLNSARTGSESGKGSSVSSFGKSSIKSGSRKPASVRGDSRGGTGLSRVDDTDSVGLILELEDDEESLGKFDESRKLFKMLQKAVKDIPSGFYLRHTKYLSNSTTSCLSEIPGQGFSRPG